MIFPAKAWRKPGLSTRMKPASTTKSGRAAPTASMKRRSPSPSSLVRKGAGSTNCAGTPKRGPRERMRAPAWSEKIPTTRARPSRPAFSASKTASALLPRPEPRMTTRMSLDFARRLDLGDEIRGAEAGEEGEKFDARAGLFQCRALARIELRQGIVAGLAVNVGPEGEDLGVEPGRAENEDGVDAGERAERVGALLL